MRRLGVSLLFVGLGLWGCVKSGNSADAQASSNPDTDSNAGAALKSAPAGKGDKLIVGYFPNWTHSRQGCEYKVEHVDASLLTHANFAFAKIDAGPDKAKPRFKIAPYDPTDPGPNGQYAQFNALKKKHPHLKTFYSIGGWTFNEGADKWIFSAMAETAERRADFIQAAMAHAREYGFDGVDIDWEYPGDGPRGGKPQDTQNFTKLLVEFRTAITAEAEKTGKPPLLLTIAAPAGSYYFRHLELDKIHEPLDWINLMTYDFAGPWDGKTGVNAPYRDIGMGIQGSVSAYLNFGVPKEKIVVGLATYGRSFANVEQPNVDVVAKGSGPPLRCTRAEGMAGYFEVMELIKAGKYKAGWDEKSSTPYAYDPAAKVWISYDDKKSITKKVEFIRQQDLRGAMFWSLDTDDYWNGYPLISIAKKILN
jgi:chitinase